MAFIMMPDMANPFPDNFVGSRLIALREMIPNMKPVMTNARKTREKTNANDLSGGVIGDPMPASARMPDETTETIIKRVIPTMGNIQDQIASLLLFILTV
jgi:hypothetical protein